MATVTTPPAPTTSAITAFEPFRALLQTQRADCVRQHELVLAETATSVPDPVAVTRAATLLRTIEEIDAALDRIDVGTYGTCVHCGGDIAPDRLEFRPFAAGCISCQETR